MQQLHKLSRAAVPSRKYSTKTQKYYQLSHWPPPAIVLITEPNWYSLNDKGNMPKQDEKVKQKAHRVILADRHQAMLEGIRSILETVFEVVVMVSDEGSLIESLEKINPDVVVADFSMPMTGGVGVVRCIKKIKPEMKVIILSVHDEPIVVEDCMSSGASGFVLKRTAADDIIPAVCEVLRGRTYVSPSAVSPSAEANG